MVSKMTLFLETLSDHKWHELKELQLKIDITEPQVIEIASFLSCYDFLTVDDSFGKVKITKSAEEFLVKTTI